MVQLSLKELKSELIFEFSGNILPYWFKYTLDSKNGGFIGQVDYKNTPIYSANKHGILNARILWSFSHSYKTLHDESSRILAQKAYNYFTENFFDTKFGGTFWELDYSGHPVNTRKHVYAQAFSIYALTEYYLAFNDKEALSKAIEIYRLIETNCKDHVNGGYFEAFSREWKACDDVRLSEKDEDEPKSMNTHLHILEAYTNLYKCHPDETIKNDLENLLDLFIDKIISSDSRMLHCFFSESWVPKSQIISFGHDIEASWLLNEAVNILDNEHLKVKIQPIVQAIADHVLSYGMDADGGLINEIILDGSNDYNKDWWPQAEAMVGFINAYQMTGNSRYLDAVYKSWAFIKKYVIDKEKGEWQEKVSRKGIPFNKMDKVRAWKAPYHNTRALLEVSRRIDKILKEEVRTSVSINSD